MADFGDVWGAANEGTQANENMFNNYIYNQAQNALVGAYGPMAGNPTGALQMQQYNYLGSADPILLQQEQAKANTMQSQAQSTAAQAQVDTDPASIQGKVNTNVGYGNNALGVGQTSLATGAQAQFFQHARALTAGLDTASQVIASGGAPEDAYNQAIRAAVSVGVPPDDPAFKQIVSPAGKQMFMANPQGTIDTLRRQTMAGYTAQLGVMDPMQRQQLINSQAQYAQTHGAMTQQAQTMLNDSRAKEDEILSTQGAMGTSMGQLRNVNSNLNEMYSLLPQMSTNAVAREARSHVPGTPEYRFEELGNSVGSGMSLDLFQNVRQQAGGSVVRGTNTEFNAAGKGLANMDIGLSPAEQKAQLDNVRSYIDPMYKGMIAKIGLNDSSYPAIVQERERNENYYHSLQSTLPGSESGAQPTVQPSYGTPAGATPSAPAQAPAGGASAPPAGQTFAPYGGHLMVPGNAASSSALPVSPAAAAGMSKVDPTFAANMERFRTDLRDKHGINTMVISSYRDPQLQSRLYANYQARQAGQPLPYPQEGNGGMAAPPGRSMHNFGLAMDMIPLDANGHPDYSNGKAQAQINQLAESYGIYPGSKFGDYDHYQAGPPGSIPGAPSGKPVNEATAPEAPTPPSRPLRTPANVASAAPSPPSRPADLGAPPQQVAGNVPPMVGGPAPQPPGQPVYRPIAAPAPNANANLRTAALAPRRPAAPLPPPQQMASAAPPQPTPQPAPQLQPSAAPQLQPSAAPPQAPMPAGAQPSLLNASSRPAAPTITPHHPTALGPPLQAPQSQRPPLIIAASPNQQGGQGNGRQQGAAAMPPRTEVMAGRALLAKYLKA